MNPNWKQIVREHLAVLRLPAEREIEIVEELALRLEAAYEDALADGLSETEAETRAVQGYDWQLLECELSRAEQPRECFGVNVIELVDQPVVMPFDNLGFRYSRLLSVGRPFILRDSTNRPIDICAARYRSRY